MPTETKAILFGLALAITLSLIFQSLIPLAVFFGIGMIVFLFAAVC